MNPNSVLLSAQLELRESHRKLRNHNLAQRTEMHAILRDQRDGQPNIQQGLRNRSVLSTRSGAANSVQPPQRQWNAEPRQMSDSS